MIFRPLHALSADSIHPVLQGIPFFKTVREQDLSQYEALVQHSQMASFGPGEVLLSKGDHDFWLFFLLRGQLDVFPDNGDFQDSINQITPGEVFGDLSMLTGRQRSASVRASDSFRQTTVLGLDFRVFGRLGDFSRLTLDTKLAYYRNTAHNLRWKLDVYRMEYPDSPLAAKHRSLKLFAGKRDTLEELEALEFQAKQLANLLKDWNQSFTSTASVQLAPEHPRASVGASY